MNEMRSVKRTSKHTSASRDQHSLEQCLFFLRMMAGNLASDALALDHADWCESLIHSADLILDKDRFI